MMSRNSKTAGRKDGSYRNKKSNNNNNNNNRTKSFDMDTMSVDSAVVEQRLVLPPSRRKQQEQQQQQAAETTTIRQEQQQQKQYQPLSGGGSNSRRTHPRIYSSPALGGGRSKDDDNNDDDDTATMGGATTTTTTAASQTDTTLQTEGTHKGILRPPVPAKQSTATATTTTDPLTNMAASSSSFFESFFGSLKPKTTTAPNSNSNNSPLGSQTGTGRGLPPPPPPPPPPHRLQTKKLEEDACSGGAVAGGGGGNSSNSQRRPSQIITTIREEREDELAAAATSSSSPQRMTTTNTTKSSLDAAAVAAAKSTSPTHHPTTNASSSPPSKTSTTAATSPSRAGDRLEAIPDYVPVEDGDILRFGTNNPTDEIEGTGPSRLMNAYGKLKRNLQKTGLALAPAAAVAVGRKRGAGGGGLESPSNLGTGLVSPSSTSPVMGSRGDDPLTMMMASKVPTSSGISGVIQRVIVSLSSAGIFHVVLFVAMAFGLVYGVYANRYQITDVDLLVDWSLELNVAFIGNSYLFVNDIPRVMEAISDYHIHQQSVIHASSGSLASVLLSGNGMYKQWKTAEAFLGNYTNSYGYNESVYDFGLCTVAQILMGYDEILSYGNKDGAYYNDKKNPCIMDRTYKEYVDELLYNNNETYVNWDYVVLVDQTKRMAFAEPRQQTVYALANAYGPLLNHTGAIPVLVDTHSFWSDETNMTGLQSVEYFQSLIYDGVEDYVNALAGVLPPWQYPVVAPIGIAYLTVYEERRSLWEKLFIVDQIHSSVHGSYLFACVLYATLYGHLPDRARSVDKVEHLFVESRKLVGSLDYPTEKEAYYYRNVARRVALRRYVPKLLRNPPSSSR